jgi:flagellar motor switch/type III secretory pathway protein FliN
MNSNQQNKEPCHRHPERTCGLKNIVNRMDCAICEQTFSTSKVKEMSTTKESESEIHEIANQISFFLGKHNVPLDRLKRLHQKFYELEDCMKSILWDEEYKRRQNNG